MHTCNQISLPRPMGWGYRPFNICTLNSNAFIRYPVGPGNLNFKHSGSPIFVAVIVKAEESTVFSFTNDFVNLDRNSTEICLEKNSDSYDIEYYEHNCFEIWSAIARDNYPITFPKVLLLLHRMCNFCPLGGTSNAHVNPSFHSGVVVLLTTYKSNDHIKWDVKLSTRSKLHPLISMALYTDEFLEIGKIGTI